MDQQSRVAKYCDEFEQTSHFLNTATVGIPPRLAVTAFNDVIEQWRIGELDALRFDGYVNRSRSAFGELIQVPTSSVGIVSQVSVASGLVAWSLPLGSKVLLAEEDFTSVLFPFLSAFQYGRIEVKLVPLDSLIDSITADISMVAVSVVQSADGRIVDLDALAARCQNLGVKTYIDATQAAGWLPIRGSEFDVVAVGAYKWLCSPRGTGFIAVNESGQSWLKPLFPGWYAGEDPWGSIYGPPLRLAEDARRYQVSPEWLSTAATAPTLELLAEIGPAEIFDHNVTLANIFCDEMNLPRSNSAIVSVSSNISPESLALQNVSAAYRDNRLRLSFHLYNDTSDVEAVLRALRTTE